MVYMRLTLNNYLMREQGARYCSKCETIKPITEFVTAGQKDDGTTKYAGACRPCWTAYIRDYRAQNPRRPRG